MENCVAPGLDKFQSIIRSCIVFGQSNHFGAWKKLKLALSSEFCFRINSHLKVGVARLSWHLTKIIPSCPPDLISYQFSFHNMCCACTHNIKFLKIILCGFQTYEIHRPAFEKGKNITHVQKEVTHLSPYVTMNAITKTQHNMFCFYKATLRKKLPWWPQIVFRFFFLLPSLERHLKIWIFVISHL